MSIRITLYRRILIFAGLLLIVAGACRTIQRAFVSPTSIGGGNGKIVFVSNRDDDDGDDTFDTDIYLMNFDGSNVERLTMYKDSEWAPDISPDGKKVLFMSSHTGGKEIFVMDMDGTNEIQVTDNSIEEGGPTWSPDSKEIAFVSKMSGDSSVEIYVVNADGTNQQRLTSNEINESDIAWSPDGNKIAYTTFGESGYDVFVMDADGTQPTQVTNSKDFNVHPCWLDNRTIVYVAWVADTIESKRKFSIFVTSAGEEYMILYTDKPGFLRLNAGIHIINLDGSGEKVLTDNATSSFGAACSPDGKHILFTTTEKKGSNIYMMDPDGSNVIAITEGEKSDLAPEW
jgi:Tol biopolymer transport system component